MSSSSNDASIAPWPDLLPELCGLIVDRLDPMSVVRFPAVCAGWNTACKKQNPPRLRSGAPTLLTSIEHNVDAGAFALHDVCAGMSFLGDDEGLKGRTWIGGKDDWLATTDYGCNVDRAPQPYHRRRPGLLATTAAGDKCWTALKNDPTASPWVDLHYMDAIVVGGKLFAVNDVGRIYTWDMMSDGAAMTTETEPTIVQGPEIEVDARDYDYDNGRRFYLATSSDGRLLLMYIHGEASGGRPRQNRMCRMVFDFRWSLCFFEHGMSLHELIDQGSTMWRRVTDLGGDRALFLGSNYPFYVAAQQHGTEDVIKANCVYVADPPNYSDRLDYSPMDDPMQMPMWFRPTTHSKLPEDI
ncbi:hypothetical protein BS78_06G262500 [Paspalum vaginatum]|nr:hypothetical protein BS78_06G262500 [Paspalum vaginatum]